jgi:hypothetical protein
MLLLSGYDMQGLKVEVLHVSPYEIPAEPAGGTKVWGISELQVIG